MIRTIIALSILIAVSFPQTASACGMYVTKKAQVKKPKAEQKAPTLLAAFDAIDQKIVPQKESVKEKKPTLSSEKNDDSQSKKQKPSS